MQLWRAGGHFPDATLAWGTEEGASAARAMGSIPALQQPPPPPPGIPLPEPAVVEGGDVIDDGTSSRPNPNESSIVNGVVGGRYIAYVWARIAAQVQASLPSWRVQRQAARRSHRSEQTTSRGACRSTGNRSAPKPTDPSADFPPTPALRCAPVCVTGFVGGMMGIQRAAQTRQSHGPVAVSSAVTLPIERVVLPT
jgi:hypothetical protein